MTEYGFYQLLLYTYIGLAALTALALRFISAPYGRHTRGGFGPQMSSTLGWLLMEAPASLAPLAFFLMSDRRDPVTIVFLLIWQTHYLHRAFIFPFRRRGGAAQMPAMIALSAIVFNLGNAYLNWRYLTVWAPVRPLAWLYDPHFLIGLALFVAGYAINQQSDHILFNLRKPGETGYKIPYGGFYRFISCPNYFGELVEWTGWAILTWSLPGAVFVLWTAANLIPRAITHHRDYHRRFPDYPKDRRAVIPLVL